MPKAQIYYFSGTGNTWAMAGLYQEALGAAGWEVELTAIDSLRGRTPNVDGDLFILGYPVHAWNLPFLVRDFVDVLPRKEGLKAACFMTMGGNSRGAKGVTWRLLASKGYNVLSVMDFIMPTNYVVGGRVGSVEAFAELRERAVPAVRQVVADLTAGRVREIEFVESEIEFSETTYPRFAASFPKFTRAFQAGETCTLCGICVDLCPYSNIRIEGDKIAYGDKCVLCLRCINLCPEQAIEYGDKTVGLGRYVAPGFAQAVLATAEGRKS